MNDRLRNYKKQEVYWLSIKYLKKINCLLEVISNEKIELNIDTLTSEQVLKSQQQKSQADKAKSEIDKLDWICNISKSAGKYWKWSKQLWKNQPQLKAKADFFRKIFVIVPNGYTLHITI